MTNENDEYYWEHLLDVVNCSRSMRRIGKGIYTCPDTGGSYRHRRAKYLGAYQDKTVSWLFEIKAVVSIGKDLSSTHIEWKNVDSDDATLKEEAAEKVRADSHLTTEIQKQALLVFLLDKPSRTNFYKSTKGGMFESKKYFRGIAKDCNGSSELAAKLKNKRWIDFETEATNESSSV